MPNYSLISREPGEFDRLPVEQQLVAAYRLASVPPDFNKFSRGQNSPGPSFVCILR